MSPHTTIIAVSLSLLCSLGAGKESLPLADAIKAFNEKTAADPIGKDQPPLTEEEAIAAIRAWERPNSKSPVSDEMYEAFKKIAETRTLPPNASFETETRSEPVPGAFVFDIWSVRIRMFRPDRSSYGFELRKRFIRSRTLEEELAHVQKRLQQFLAEEREREEKQELMIGSWKIGHHLEMYIETLKARIAEQKAK